MDFTSTIGSSFSQTDQTGTGADPSTYGQNDITDPAVFADTYTALVGEFKANNEAVQGVLINVLDVTAIPYFTVVPYNPIGPEKLTAEQVQQLNAAYANYNQGVMAILGDTNLDEAEKRQIKFDTEGPNAPVILDEDLTDLTGINPPATLLILKSSPFLCVQTPTFIVCIQRSILDITAS